MWLLTIDLADLVGDIVLTPPQWLRDTTQRVAGTVVLIAFYRLYQQEFRLPLDRETEMLDIASVVVGVMCGVLVVANVMRLPYLADVVGGWLLGILAVRGIGRLPWASWLSDWTPRERLMLGWLVVGWLGLMLPGRLQLRGEGYLPNGMRFVLFLWALSMVLYDAALEHRSRQRSDGAAVEGAD